MRSLSLVVITVLMTVLSQAQTVSDKFIRPLPSPAKAVVDFAHLLSKKQFNALAKDLRNYQRQSSNAIVILTLETLTDPETEIEYPIESVATDYFNTWGIGDSIKNNGVLILVVPSERKLRIEVGSGLEEVLTNDECAQIIREQIVPQFKEQQYYQGLVDAVTAIKQELDEPAVTEEQSPEVADSTYASYTPTATTTDELTFTSYSTSPNYAGVLVTLVSLFIICIFIFNVFMKNAGKGGGLFSGNGYHSYYDSRHRNYNNDDDDRHRFSSSSSFSSSDDSSSSSSSDSFSGGSSSGGGASGSW